MTRALHFCLPVTAYVTLLLVLIEWKERVTIIHCPKLKVCLIVYSKLQNTDVVHADSS